MVQAVDWKCRFNSCLRFLYDLGQVTLIFVYLSSFVKQGSQYFSPTFFAAGNKNSFIKSIPCFVSDRTELKQKCFQ